MAEIEVGDRIEFTEDYNLAVRGTQGIVTHARRAPSPWFVTVLLDSGEMTTAFYRRMRKIAETTTQEKTVAETPTLIGFTVPRVPATEPVQPLVRLPLSQEEGDYSVYDNTGRLLFNVDSLGDKLSWDQRKDIAAFLIAAVHEKVANDGAGALYRVTADNVGAEPPTDVSRITLDGDSMELVRRGTGWWWVDKGEEAPPGDGWAWSVAVAGARFSTANSP